MSGLFNAGQQESCGVPYNRVQLKKEGGDPKFECGGGASASLRVPRFDERGGAMKVKKGELKHCKKHGEVVVMEYELDGEDGKPIKITACARCIYEIESIG